MIELLFDLDYKTWKDHKRRFANICKHGKNGFELDYYTVEQIQEYDRAGWTKVYRKDKLIAVINWQATGIMVYTIDPEFGEGFLNWEHIFSVEIVTLDDLKALDRKLMDLP